jgi:DNA-binding SARP family transcriptional activator/tetratricopeptide (TPR) repeat protein
MGEHEYTYPIILNKVTPPRYVTPTLRRGRLLGWLHQNASCRAIVLAADAGYGKTTLLWQFGQEAAFPVHWYKLDRADRDWSLQITYLVESIAQRHPGFGGRATSMLRQLGGPGTSRPGVAAYLLSEMHERLTEPCTFIIDDWQFVSGVTEVRGLWNQILRDAPPTCRFIFASRAKPILQFARFKTHGGYAELRTDAFRFTDQEIEQLFREIYRDPLDPSEVTELERRTEGWAASLQLVEVSLREKQTPDERRSFIESITATRDSDLFAFLAEEVLDQQTDETRNFLLSTSILQQITPDLAERLAGIHDGERQLADLEQRGLFTYRVDEARYRYHGLFRDFLERRLSVERGEAEIIGLHIHAASYFETHEHWPHAIHHYLKAGLQRQAARLIARYGEDLVAEGRLGMVDEWLEELPERTVRENARLSLLHGEALGMRGEFEPALAALQRARGFFARKGDRRMESLACVKLSTVHNGRGDIALSAEAAEDGLRLVPDDAPAIRLRLHGNLALSSAWLGDASLASSLETVARLSVEAEALGLDHFAAIAHHNLGAMQRDVGDLQPSLANLEKAARFWGELPDSPFADNSDLVATLLALGHVAQARRMADAGVASTRNWRRPNAEALGGRAMVLIYQERFDEALSLLRQLLEQPGTLGALVDVYRALAAEILCLTDAEESQLVPIRNLLMAEPRDPRHTIHVETALALVADQSGRCRGTCLAATTAIERWRSRGAIFAAAVAEAKLSSLAFRHKRRAWIIRAVNALQFLSGRGSLGYVRQWTRRLIPHATAVRGACPSIDLMLALHEADPAAWEDPLVARLPVAVRDERAAILKQIAKRATRRTRTRLRTVQGSDVAVLRQELIRQQSPRLYLRTFGPLTIHRGGWDGPKTPVTKRRLRSLLALLASHSGTFLSRDTVLEALWPDAAPGSAVNNLNQSVFQVRRLLDPDYQDGDGAPYVIATGEQLAFDTQLVRTDLEEFRRLKTRIIPEISRAERRTAAEQLLNLISGEYLADARYEEWAYSLMLAVELEVRESLLPMALGKSLPDFPDLGLKAARALAALDEFDEMAHAAMARHLAAMGKRHKATEIINDLSARLKRELGTGMSTEARAALQSVGIQV